MKNRDPILLFFTVSILFHLVLYLFGIGPASKLAALVGKQKEEAPVEFSLFDGKSQYQIADIAKPEKEEKPDNAKFVGVYDSRVDEETVAPSRRPSAGSGESSQKSPESSDKSQEKQQTSKNEKPDQKTEDAQEGADVSEQKVADKKSEKKSSPSSGQAGLNDYMESGLPEDYFPNYKVGEHTYLNVLRFPKVSYFVRLKKIFNTTWNPRSALMYSGMNQLAKGQVEVVLGVTVDKSGNLSEMFVINSSGLPTYDQEAQRTIKDSSPFAAPPKELLDEGAKLRMVWTFTVYM